MSEDDRVGLKEYVERIFIEKEKALLDLLKAYEKALELATRNLETRLHMLNEWKSETLKEREQYLQSAVFVKSIEAITLQINAIDKRVSDLSGSVKVLIPLSAVIGGIIGAALAVIMRGLLKG